MSTYIHTYPQDKYRFALYDNADKLTWRQIKERTGCVGLVNLWYFKLATFENDAGVKIGGKWVRPAEYDWPGICIDADGRVSTGGITTDCPSYAASVQADYLGGVNQKSKAWAKNGVTYTGLKANGDVVILVSPKTTTQLTGAQAVSMMLSHGCKDILRWDGSYSSQGYIGGKAIDPTQPRKVRGYLLIFERKEGPKVAFDKQTIKGTRQQLCTKFPYYTAGKTITPVAIMVHSTAIPGRMAQAQRDAWDRADASACAHFVLDDKECIQCLPVNCKGAHAGTGSSGRSANNTHLSFEVCEPRETRLLPVNWLTLSRGGTNNAAWVVERLQRELVARGYDPNGIDGSFGAGCEKAVKAFQRDHDLTVDGKVGKATLLALQTRSGSHLYYPAAEMSDYFRAVFERSVKLCAELCRTCRIQPESIICHADGYQQGIASNHADVLHWWPMHGVTMGAFRAAVIAELTPPVDPLETLRTKFGLTDAELDHIGKFSGLAAKLAK